MQGFNDTLDPRALNYALVQLQDYYTAFGDSRFFDIKTLVSGEMDITYRVRDFTYLDTLWSSNDGTLRTTMPIDYIVACAYLTDEEYIIDYPAHNIIIDGGFIQLTMDKTDGYEYGSLNIAFYQGSNSMPCLNVLYNLTYSSVNITGVMHRIYIDGQQYSPDAFYDVAISYSISNTNEYYTLPFFVNSIFSSTYSAWVYPNFVYSPKDFYQGYSKSYDIGYTDASRYAYDEGYDAGKIDGISHGYDIGKADGYQEGLQDNSAYNLGYLAAERAIDSGEWGANFIGNIFGNITSALNNFKLYEHNGLAITLGAVLAAGIGISLFIWILKCIAGG